MSMQVGQYGVDFRASCHVKWSREFVPSWSYRFYILAKYQAVIQLYEQHKCVTINVIGHLYHA